MATWGDVRRIAAALPGMVELAGQYANQWKVNGKLVVWERPLRAKELVELGDAAPDGPVLCAKVPDLGAKEALLADPAGVYFTTAHFDGYSMVLVRLDRITVADLEELVIEAWLSRAPKRLAKAYLDSRSG